MAAAVDIATFDRTRLAASIGRGAAVGAVVGAGVGMADMAITLNRSLDLSPPLLRGVAWIALSILVVASAGAWIGAALNLVRSAAASIPLPHWLSWRDGEALLLSMTATACGLVTIDSLRVGLPTSGLVLIGAGAPAALALTLVLRRWDLPGVRPGLWVANAAMLFYLAMWAIYEISRTVTMGDLHFLVVATALGWAIFGMLITTRWPGARPIPLGVTLALLASPLLIPPLIGASAGHQTRLVLSERSAITYRVLWKNDLYRLAARGQMPDTDHCDDVLDPPRLGAQVATPPREVGDADLVVIIIDTLRHDMVGAHRDGVELTPNLDALSDEALHFQNAWATTPSTVTTVGSILTGLATGLGDLPRWKTVEERSLLGDVEDHHIWTGLISGHATMTRLGEGAEYVNDRVAQQVADQNFRTAAKTTEDALAAAQTLAEDPHRPRGLLLVHYFDPHDPYLPHPAPFDFGRSPWSRYQGEVASTDRAVGELIEGVREVLGAQTAILILSDHGEEFWDHGYRYHAVRLYDESVRMVALLDLPGYPGEVVNAPASSADVAPTILDFFGLNVPDDLEGRSWLRPLPQERPIFLHILNRKKVAVIDGDHKLILNRRPQILELYNLSSDPQEQDNLVDAHPELVDQHLCTLMAWKQERGL